MSSIRWTAELKDEVKALWVDHSATEIAALFASRHGFNLTRSSIIGLIHRMGLTAQGKTRRALTDNTVRRRAKRKPKLRVVANGGGGMRLQMSVTGEVGPLRCVEVEPRLIGLAELKHGDCRYPYGDGPFQFCGLPQKVDSPYCEPHHALCRMPARSPDRPYVVSAARKARAA